MLPDIRIDGPDAHCTFIIKTDAAISQKPGTVEKIVDDQGFKNI
jgi:hypothetical protein